MSEQGQEQRVMIRRIMGFVLTMGGETIDPNRDQAKRGSGRTQTTKNRNSIQWVRVNTYSLGLDRVLLKA